MPTPIIDALKDDSDLTMHSHTEADLGATLDNRYVNVTGDTMTGNLILNDNVSVLLGTGSDGELFHDGSNTYFQNNTGGIIIENDASDGDITFKVNDGGVDKTVMTLDGATGNVGIGTTSPAVKLHLNVTDATGIKLASSDTSSTTSIIRGDNGASVFADDADYNGTSLVARDTSSSSINLVGGTIKLSTDTGLTSGNTFTATTRMHIGTDGFIGVGTEAPGAIFTVEKSSNATTYANGLPAVVVSNTNTTGSSFAAYKMQADNSGVVGEFFADGNDSFGIGSDSIYFRATTNHPMAFGTNNSVRMVISNTGNVGIGTTSPLGTLDTRGSATAGTWLGLFAQNGITPENSAVLLTAQNKAVSVQGDGAAYFMGRDVTNDIEFIMGTSNLGTAFAGSMTAHDFQLRTDNLTRVTIQKTTGNVGIGTTSPVTKLDLSYNSAIVSIGARFVNTATSGSTSGAGMVGLSDDGAAMASGDRLGYFLLGGSYDNSHTLTNTAGMSGFATEAWSATNKGTRLAFEGTPTGSATRAEWMTIKDGNVGIGTTAPAGRLHINGTADDEQLIVEGHSTQTANLTEWRNSSGAVLGGVAGDGRFGIGTTPIASNKLYVSAAVGDSGSYNAFTSDISVATTTDTAYAYNALNFSVNKSGAYNVGFLRGVIGSVYHSGSGGTTSSMQAIYTNVGLLGASSAGVISNAYHIVISQINRAVGSTTTVGNAYGINISNQGDTYVTSAHGIYIHGQTGATNNYAILTNAGNIVFNEGGDASTDFRVESDTEANMLFVDANANTDGSVYLGGTTNGIEIKKGGDLTLLGTAKYERHVQIPAMANGLPANQPAEVDFFTAGGLQFASAGAQYAYCQWEIPDDWDGTDVVFEVDWFPDSGAISGTDTIKWDVEYRSIAEGEAINNGTSVTVSVTDSTDYAQYITKHSRFTLTYNNANQPLVNQDHIYFKISRDTSVANDFAGTVTVAAYEIIYQSKGFPSSN